MAETVNYGMGQLRYPTYSPYMIDQEFTSKIVKTVVTSGSNQYYQDIYICKNKTSDNTSSYNFEEGVPYLLHIEIPKDQSYSNTFQVKLIQEPQDKIDESTNFQLIKYISVPKLVGGGKVSRIILFPVNSETEQPGFNDDGTYMTKIAIATTECPGDDGDVGEVFYKVEEDKYYYRTIDKSWIKIENKHDILLEHTWVTQNTQIERVSFDIIFTPRSNNIKYQGILLQMVRTTNVDYDIYSNGYYGRRINLNEFNAEVYKLKNLIAEKTNDTGLPNSLTSIGVYSHPNLLMAINGEEIRVGPSGYYELNNFDITSLAIAASDDNDKFTLDYQYKITN